MDAILEPIARVLEGFLSNPIVQLASQLIVIYVVLLWLGTAYWAFRDMQARTENPILPYFAAALIIFFTPLLFVFAVVLYLIVRPRETLAEVYERSLAEECLLAEVEKNELCPVCRDRVDADWLVCPNCRTRLHRVCPSCNRLAEPTWPLCAYCGREFERPLAGGIACPYADAGRGAGRRGRALRLARRHGRARTPARRDEHLTEPPAWTPLRPDGPGSLPTGPHPTMGPGTVRCRAGPGPVLAVGGALLAIGALVAVELDRRGTVNVDRGPLRSRWRSSARSPSPPG